MSDQSLDLSVQIARIDQMLGDSHRAQIESNKFQAEQRKLMAEAMKYDRDRQLQPWLAVVAIAGGVGGILAGIQAALRLTGVLH